MRWTMNQMKEKTVVLCQVGNLSVIGFPFVSMQTGKNTSQHANGGARFCHVEFNEDRCWV